MLTRKRLEALRHDWALESRTRRADRGLLVIVILLAKRTQYSAYSLEETPSQEEVCKRSGPLSPQRMIEWVNLQIDPWRQSLHFGQLAWKDEPIAERIQTFVQQIHDRLA